MNTLATLAAALPYGCAIYYAAKVQGVPTLFLEIEGDAIAPTGYALDDSLIVDEAPKLGSQIGPQTHMGAAFDFTFSFRDTATIRQLFSRPANVTTLTQDETASATTLHVKSTTGFESADTLYVGNQAVPYTSTTGVTFDGGTRGVYGAASALKSGQVVSDGPRYWVRRKVDLYAVLIDSTGRYVQGADVLSEAAHVWSGFVVARPVRGTVTWDLAARSIDRRLSETLGTSATGTAWWDLNDDHVVEFEPNATWHVRIEDAYMNSLDPPDGDTTLIEDVSFRPWTSLTSPARISKLREAVVTAWGSITHATGIGAWQWFPILPEDGAGLTQTWRGYISYVSQTANLVYSVVTSRIEGASPFTTTNGAPTWSGQTWVATGASQPATTRVASLSVDLSDTSPSDLPPSGWIRLGDKDTAEYYRYESFTTDDVVGSRVHLQLASQTQPDLAALGLLDVSEEGLKPLDAAFVWRATGPFADVMRQMILSVTGDGSNGAYDVLGVGGGYAIPAEQVNADSFDEVMDGSFTDLTADIGIDGEVSFARVFSDLLRLSNRGVVVTLTDEGPKITAVNLGAPDSGTASVTITDDDLVWAPGGGVTSPVRASSTRVSIPGRIEVSPQPGPRAPGAPDPVPIVAKNVEANEFGQDSWSLKVFGVESNALANPVRYWATSYFVAAETTQWIEVDVAPSVAAEPGDLVMLNLIDPGVWDYDTGTPGYVGLARVWGSPVHPTTGIKTLFLSVGGAADARPLSPSAAVGSWTGTSTAPTAISVNRAYFRCMSSYLPSGGTFTLQAYRPGNDATGEGYTIDGVTDNGSVCWLSVASVTGSPNLSVGDYVLTLPTVPDGNEAQNFYVHSGQPVQWSA